MGLPRLETCCFLFDLKTGNIVLGCVNIFFSFVMVIWMIVESVIAGSLMTLEAREVKAGVADVEDQAAATGLYAMTIILVLMFIAKLFFDILFVYGVIHERANIIKAYFIMWLVFFLLSGFTFFINVMEYDISTTITVLFYMGLNVYAVLLCHSFYKQLNEREEV